MTSPPIESHTDVLIVGAGPSGLFCANGLVHAGVSVRIVDKRPVKVPAGHADGLQPRTLEVLQSYGLAKRVLDVGCKVHMAAFYHPGPDGPIELSQRGPGIVAENARYPYEATLHQGTIETILLDSISEKGVEVDRPVEPIAVEVSKDENALKDASAYPISVTLLNTSTNTTELVHAKFLVGCDGAHSYIRKALDIAMVGQQTPFVWGVVDLVPKTDFPDIRYKCFIHSDNGSLGIVPREKDRVRLYIQLEGGEEQKEGQRSQRKVVSTEKLLEVAQKAIEPYTLEVDGEVHWSTNYAIGQRLASQYSVSERAFIAGDACHTHSPKAGQGMNASMNDTHNLIWKLVLVLRGVADPSLLKTYESERRKYAEDLINFDKEYSRYFSTKPRNSEGEDGVSHEQFIQAFKTFGGFTSGIGIHYGPSPIVNPANQSYATNLVVGKRVPPHVFIRSSDADVVELQDLIVSNVRFKLLFFLGDVKSQEQRDQIDTMACRLTYLRDHPYEGLWDLVTLCEGNKYERSPVTDLPTLLRPHWSNVLIDDTDTYDRVGGGGFAKFGIHAQGAVVVARPDGYIGMVSSLESAAEDIRAYFAGFLRV